MHERHPRLAHARAVRHEPKLRQLGRRERRRGVCPPELEVFLPLPLLLVLLLLLLLVLVRMVRERLRERERELVWVWVGCVWKWEWEWKGPVWRGVLGGTAERGRRRGRLGLGGQRSLGRRGILVRRGHVLRERRLHGLERVLRLGRRVAVLLVLMLLLMLVLVLRRVRGWLRLYGRDKVGVVADVLFLALEPLTQHRLRWLAWPLPLPLPLRRLRLRVGLRVVGRQFHHTVCSWWDGRRR